MIQIVIWIAVGLSAFNLVLLAIVLKQLALIRKNAAGQIGQDEFQSLCEEVSRLEREIRNEVRTTQETTTNTLVTNIGEFSKTLTAQVERMRSTIDERFQSLQQNNDNKLEQIRQAVTEQLQGTTDTLVNTVGELGKSQESQLEGVRKTVHERLEAMQNSNEKKLDQMRRTVDEQLQSTLEKRLGESFSIVSENLEAVHRGLGEMQNLATGVGDLRRVLTNVKTRGTWGEVQLESLLEEVLAPDQYNKNVQVRENSRERVEYAIRLPGSNDEPDSCVWLPIDSKFPLADYDKLVDAADASDAAAVQDATRAFMRRVQDEAKNIRDKYISIPKTTDFAIMFLPTEGLYAEVLRAPGQVTELLQSYRIVVAGPTTLAAILSSLRMGFRTLAIKKHSSEVWEVLAAAKTEFDQFGELMDTLKRQLDTASKTIDKTGVRRRAIKRKLQTIEALSPEEAAARLDLPDSEQVINWDGVND